MCMANRSVICVWCVFVHAHISNTQPQRATYYLLSQCINIRINNAIIACKSCFHCLAHLIARFDLCGVATVAVDAAAAARCQLFVGRKLFFRRFVRVCTNVIVTD